MKKQNRGLICFISAIGVCAVVTLIIIKKYSKKDIQIKKNFFMDDKKQMESDVYCTIKERHTIARTIINESVGKVMSESDTDTINEEDFIDMDNDLNSLLED